MAKLLVNLRGLPDDEIDEIRELLSEHKIDFYETPASRWGFSMGGIWLRDESQEREAKQLLAAYQKKRQLDARAEHERQKQAGTADTLLGNILRNPLRFLLLIIALAVVLYVTIMPFLHLSG